MLFSLSKNIKHYMLCKSGFDVTIYTEYFVFSDIKSVFSLSTNIRFGILCKSAWNGNIIFFIVVFK